MTHQEMKICCMLLWLGLTATYEGWEHPLLLGLNIIMLLVAAPWAIRAVGQSKLSLPAGWLIGAIIAVFVSSLATASYSFGLFQVFVWFGYLAVYYAARDWPAGAIHRAALVALLIYAPFAVWGSFNQNVAALNLVALALLALPAVGMFGPYLLGLVAMLLIWPLESIGGALAVGVGAVLYLEQRPVVLAGAIPLAGLGWWLSPASYEWRLQFWADAWRAFLAHPLVGVGAGMYHVAGGWQHAHNFILNWLAECGLLGLGVVIGAGVLVFQAIRKEMNWAAVIILTFAAWSMVDYPFYFWLPGTAIMMSLAHFEKEIESEQSKRMDY